MQDSIIVPNHYAYSLRVDAKTQEYNSISKCKQLLKEFKQFQERFSTIKHHFIYIEQSAVVDKTHIQGILWTINQLKHKDMSAMRQWWKRPSGHISFVNAKKIKSLASYCSKDLGERSTSLSDHQLNLIPKWINAKADWKTKLQLFLTNEVACTNGFKDYACEIIKFYITNSKAPPNRATIYKHLLRNHPDFDANDYARQINLFKEENY